MPKKEAHAKALKMFIDSRGKTSLKAIAEAVGTSYFFVVRWHNKENWKGKIKAIKVAPTGKRRKSVEGVVIRKKALFDQAVRLFNESGGKISNAELGRQLKVTKTTIAVWKKMPQWGQAAPETVIPEPSEPAPPQAAPAPKVTPPAQPSSVDIEAIISPQDLVTLNERLRSILERNFLTAADIEHLSNAKLTLLEAAEVYLGIVRGSGD